jgi:hypothetical protein
MDLITHLDEYNDSKDKITSTPIPVILSLELPGIAGIKIGNIFNVTGGNNTRILPASFKGINILNNTKQNQDVAFLVKNISHSVEGNIWTTHIEGYPFVIPKIN